MNRPSSTPRSSASGLTLHALLLIVAMSTGCATTGIRAPSLLPTAHQLRTGPFVIYSNTPVLSDSPSVRALEELQNDLATSMDCREDAKDDPIEVYVLDDRAAFLHLLRFHFPELPPRRAFFLAQGAQRLVYTYNGPMLEEDLRHEATHALLRGRFGDVPLWLDEGLAEYFEVGPSDLQDRHDRLARLARDMKSGWSPNISRLEALHDIHQMNPRDYRESWAWVDFMLSESKSGTSTLVDFLERSQNAVHPDPLSKTLGTMGTNDSSLLAHLGASPSRVVAHKPGPIKQEREQVVRLQDRSSEIQYSPPQRIGLIRRIGAFLGL